MSGRRLPCRRDGRASVERVVEGRRGYVWREELMAELLARELRTTLMSRGFESGTVLPPLRRGRPPKRPARRPPGPARIAQDERLRQERGGTQPGHHGDRSGR